jgi:ADP-ribose pyrophosphatase
MPHPVYPADDATPANVQIATSHTAFLGHFRVHRYLLRHRRHAGGWTDWVTREVFERRPTVAVLLYDPRADAVVLLTQFRLGALAAGKPCWQHEIVAGEIEGGETPATVARRETLEEAGAAIYRLIPMHDVVISPGPSTERARIYCGLVDSRALGGLHGVAAEQEDIRAEVVPFTRAQSMLAAGLIDNAPAIIALQWLALHRPDLRAEAGR